MISSLPEGCVLSVFQGIFGFEFVAYSTNVLQNLAQYSSLDISWLTSLSRPFLFQLYSCYVFKTSNIIASESFPLN